MLESLYTYVNLSKADVVFTQVHSELVDSGVCIKRGE